MVNIVKVISSEIDKLNRRVVKYLRLGKDDVQSSLTAAPYGVDANPIKDMVAIYATSTSKEEKVIIGYINKNQLAEAGEHRIFSTDDNGVLQTFIWLKKDGNILLGGEADNAVRYAALNTELQAAIADINTNLGLIATGIAAAGGSYSPQNLSLDISGAKIDTIKTP